MTNERQRKIVKRIETRGFATIEALAQKFDVSAQTIRRDIIRLDKTGLLQRFHGGAGLPRDSARLGYSQKKITAVAGKQRIGRAAAALIPDGSAVFLDVGTTVEGVARALAGRGNLSVFTNSLAAAGALAGSQDMKVVVTGGLLHGADGSLVGGDVTTAVLRFKFDVAVIACSGFDDDGSVMDFDLQKVSVKNAAIESARLTILVADGSKFKRTAFVRISALENFSHVVTDKEPPMALRKALQKAGVEVVVA
jgi:DeoR family transcriptional regulator, glycerol-3-phosphate regulon repressor